MKDTHKNNLKALAALILLIAAIYDSSCAVHCRGGRYYHPLLWVLYCVKIFDPNRKLVVGIWFDIWSLGKQFIIFARSAFVVIPSLLIIRRLNLKNTRVVQYVFSIASVLVLTYPATFLFLFGYDVWRYVQKMGLTFDRIKGLFAAGFYGVALIVFAVWLLLFSNKKMVISERRKMFVINVCTVLSIFYCINLFYNPLRLWRYKYLDIIWKASQLVCFPALLLVPFAFSLSYTACKNAKIKWFRMIVNGIGFFAILLCIG